MIGPAAFCMGVFSFDVVDASSVFVLEASVDAVADGAGEPTKKSTARGGFFGVIHGDAFPIASAARACQW